MVVREEGAKPQKSDVESPESIAGSTPTFQASAVTFRGLLSCNPDPLPQTAILVLRYLSGLQHWARALMPRAS